MAESKALLINLLIKLVLPPRIQGPLTLLLFQVTYWCECMDLLQESYWNWFQGGSNFSAIFLVCERDYGESEEKGKEAKPFGIGRSEVSVNGREEIESALQRLEAQLLQRLWLHGLHLHLRRRFCLGFRSNDAFGRRDKARRRNLHPLAATTARLC